MPQPPFPGSALTGRVFVLGGFLSASTEGFGMEGMGAVEMRVLVPGGCGRGVFVGDREFLLPPGTTLRVAGTGRNVLFMERVRGLLTPARTGGLTPEEVRRAVLRELSEGDRIDPAGAASAEKANRALLSECRVPQGFLPAFSPAPTEPMGWMPGGGPRIFGVYG